MPLIKEPEKPHYCRPPVVDGNGNPLVSKAIGPNIMGMPEHYMVIPNGSPAYRAGSEWQCDDCQQVWIVVEPWRGTGRMLNSWEEKPYTYKDTWQQFKDFVRSKFKTG